MVLHQRLLTVFGACVCLVCALGTVVSVSSAASASRARVSNAAFDIHTPLPVKPCNGAQFYKSTPIPFQWGLVFNTSAYVWKENATSDSLTTSSTWTTWSPGRAGVWSWKVYTLGSWGRSEDSQVCDFTTYSDQA